MATAAGKRLTVIVNVDSSPQPYARLERAIVENGQQFGTKRTFTPPQTVPHLGLDASWFPDLDQLLTSDGHVLITIDVHCAIADGGRPEGLGGRARADLPRDVRPGVGEGAGALRVRRGRLDRRPGLR